MAPFLDWALHGNHTSPKYWSHWRYAIKQTDHREKFRIWKFSSNYKPLVKYLVQWIGIRVPISNRLFSKMAATDLNELKLNWMKNWYQHWKEHLYFSNLAKFQRIRCYISQGNVRWNLTNLQTFVWLGVYVIPPVTQTSVNIFIFHFTYYTWYAETLQGY